MWPAPAANIAARTASAYSGGDEDHPLVQVGSADRRCQHVLHRQAQRLGERVGHPGRGGVGVGVRGEQRAAGADQPVHQRTLGGVGRDGVHAAQQQRVVRQQQPAVGHLVDDGGGGVDRDRHRVDVVAGIAADQADRVPVLRQRGRVGRLQHVDDLGQAHAHAGSRSLRPRSCLAAILTRGRLRALMRARPRWFDLPHHDPSAPSETMDA